MILFKIEPTPRRLLYFVNRHSVELSEIGPHLENGVLLKIEVVTKCQLEHMSSYNDIFQLKNNC